MAGGMAGPSKALTALLTDLSLDALAGSLPSTALFFAERLHALSPSSEQATWLLALCLSRGGQHKASARFLSQTMVAISSETTSRDKGKGKGKQRDEDVFGIDGGWDTGMADMWMGGAAGHRAQRVANLSSVRCAQLYAEACRHLGRPKEGLEVLRRAMRELGTRTAEASPKLPTSPSIFSGSLSVLCLEGELSLRSHDYVGALSSFRSVLTQKSGSLCWEAFEGLCKTGCADFDWTIFDRPPAALGATMRSPLLPQPAPPPAPTHASAPPATSHGTNGLFTPADQAMAPSRPADVRRPANAPNNNPAGIISRDFMNMGEMSVDDSSLASFDQSYYAGRQGLQTAIPLPQTKWASVSGASTAGAAASAISSWQPNVIPQRTSSASSSSSFATPSASEVQPAPRGPPGVKRNRAGVANGTSKSGKPGATPSTIATAPPTTTRKSARGRETTADGRPIAGSSRVASSSAKGATTTARETKRQKSYDAGTASSDAGGDITSPEIGFGTKGSLPPASPEIGRIPNGLDARAGLSAVDEEDPERAEAVEWLMNVLRRFAKATFALSKCDAQGVLDAIYGLSAEQKRTWKAYCLIARAKFELLEYHSAEIAFSKARHAAPYLAQHMDLYSTLLWHLRKPSQLSFLAQELQVLDPLSAESWIATGNVFSLIDDHANALRCFRRATQVDDTRPYAFTLSGHECVGLEEWDRALGFFREAIRRDQRHYNAWFGMGEVYLKQGKLRMAEYHFRQAAALNPTNALLLCAIGNVLEKRGKLKEAREVYEKGVVLAPAAATVRFCRAKVLVALKEYDAARLDLIMLKDVEPTEFNVHFLLGKVYSIMGDKPAAARQLAYAQDLNPQAAARIRKVLDGGVDVEEDTSKEDPPEVQTRLDEVSEEASGFV